MTRLISVLTVVLFIAASSALSADFTIPSFATGGRSIPPQGDEVIAASPGAGALKEIPSFSSLAPGEVVMRRRFSGEEYRLYKGVFAKTAFGKENNLFSFGLPAGMTIANIAAFKLYDDRVTNPNNDLPTVYIDNTHVYVRKISRLYFNSGTWQELSATNVKVEAGKARPVGDIAVVSNPAGARIAVDGENKGVVTPNYVTELFAGRHTVAVSLPDYQNAEKVVDVKAGEVMNVQFDLLSALGSVEITSTPAGAAVTFNNVESGVTPLTLKKLTPGTYAVNLSLDLYKPASKQFVVTMNKNETVAVSLEPDFGTLQLPSPPAKVSFTVDEKPFFLQ